MVGECLRALVSKFALKEVEHCLQALHPLQIGVGGNGPVIQADILGVKSWLKPGMRRVDFEGGCCQRVQHNSAEKRL